MQRERKTALVLGGGGSHGAYEIGVWQGLLELDIPIDMVFGTSVGAINGALILQDDFDKASTLWCDLKTELIFDVKRNSPLAFCKEFLINGGAETSGLKALLTRYLDETLLRSSPIDYGIVTTEFPSMKPLYLMREQIPRGQLIDYILASAACFPAAKHQEIGTKKFLDGGYYDNLPVSMANEEGATHVIAVDLNAPGIIHKEDLSDAEHLKFIESPWDLGNFLVFEQDNIKRLIRLGYQDVLKAYGIYEGTYYTFVKGEFSTDMLDKAEKAAKIFELPIEPLYLKSVFDHNLRKAFLQYQKKTNPAPMSDPKLAFPSNLAESCRKALTLALLKKTKSDSEDGFLTKFSARLLKDEKDAADYLKQIL